MITIKLDILPKTTNTLHGKHWAIRHAEKKNLMNLIRAETSGQIPKQPFKKAKITCTRFSSTSPDYDGLVQSFKVCIDILVELGIIEDDNMSAIGKPEYDWFKCKKGEGRIVITVTDNTDQCPTQ